MATSAEQHAYGSEIRANVRRAGPTDADGLEGLCTQLGYSVESEELRTRLMELLDDPASDVLVAEVEGRVTGLATLYYVPVMHEAGRWARMTALVVDESERGHGVGASLLEASERAARAHGCSRIEATSAFHRADAHAFYERCGFEQVSAHFLKRLK